MTVDLDNDNQVSFNAFRDKGWLKVRSCGGGLLVQMTPEQVEELGLAMWVAARKMKRG
jgi:hypothetical protein